MNRISLLIISSDIEYANALGKALMLKDNKYLVCVYKDSLELDSKNIKSISDTAGSRPQLILIDSFLVNRIKKDEDGDVKVIYLELGEVADYTDKKDYIFKYQGLDSIHSYILQKYAECNDEKRIGLNYRNTRIMGFASAAGGVGTSSIAISLARELTMTRDKKILYLCYERVESTAVYFPGDNGKQTINEYLYYLFKKENNNLSSYIDVFINTDLHGLSAFRPARLKSELWDLNPGELLRFIKSLLEPQIFDYIFIDLPLDGTVETTTLLRFCSRLLLVDDGGPLSIYKNNKTIKSLSGRLDGEDENSIINVTNKWESKKEDSINQKGFYIEYDPESFADNGQEIEISLSRRFGLGIRRIADEFDTWL